MNNKFECHITFDYKTINDLAKLEALGNTHGFKFSYITNDPVLGNRTFAYLTKYGHSNEYLQSEMGNIATICNTDTTTNYPPIVRTKVEKIVFDSKTHQVHPNCEGKGIYED